MHDKLIERIDEKHGDHDGMIEFEEFLPWSVAFVLARVSQCAWRGKSRHQISFWDDDCASS